MIYPSHTSPCTSTIESAEYENRMFGAVRGRRLITASYSIFFSEKKQKKIVF